MVLLLAVPCFAEAPPATPSFTVDEDTIFIQGKIDAYTAAKVESKLRQLQKKKLFKPSNVNIVIDSGGGSVIAGIKIIRLLDNLNATVNCLVDNFAASMAAMILETCDNRFVLADSIVMFHEASGGFQGPFNIMKTRQGFVYELVESYERRVAARLNLTFREYKEQIVSEMWLLGNHAVVANAADFLLKGITCELRNCNPALNTKSALASTQDTQDPFKDLDWITENFVEEVEAIYNDRCEEVK